MELLLAAKIISMFTLGLATWIIGLVPLIAVKRGWLSRKESDGDSRLGTVLSCLMCFGGGVIMTSSLAHMLPDVNEVLDLSLEHGTFPDTGQPFCYFAVIFMDHQMSNPRFTSSRNTCVSGFPLHLHHGGAPAHDPCVHWQHSG